MKEVVPSVDIDRKFKRIPHFAGIDFDIEAYRSLLLELGLPEERMGNVLVHLTPHSAALNGRLWTFMDQVINGHRAETPSQGRLDLSAENGTARIIVALDRKKVENNTALIHESQHAVDHLTEDDFRGNYRKEGYRGLRLSLLGSTAVGLLAFTLTESLVGGLTSGTISSFASGPYLVYWRNSYEVKARKAAQKFGSKYGNIITIR